MVFKKQNYLTDLEIAAFCEQMSMILHSGISSLEGIAIFRDESEGFGKEVFSRMYDTLENTGSLSMAMEDSGIFPAYAIKMTELGMQSGKTDEVMQSLCEYYTREETIRRRIKSAVTYPLIMIGMMFLVILILLTKVLPIFNQVYRQLGSELTGISRSFLNLGLLLSRYSAVLIFLLAAAAVFLFFFLRRPSGKQRFFRLLRRIPLFAHIQEAVSASRFAAGMALGLESGLDTDQSLELSAGLLTDEVILKKIEICRDKLAQGEGFSESLEEAKIFTGIYSRMLSIGFKTGAADQVFKRVAAQYESDLDDRLNHLISILEPTLVAILSFVVGMILLSVMLPLLGIMSSVGI